MGLNEGYIYAKAKRTINGKTYVGAAIGIKPDTIEKTERAAIRNLLEKIKYIDETKS